MSADGYVGRPNNSNDNNKKVKKVLYEMYNGNVTVCRRPISHNVFRLFRL